MTAGLDSRGLVRAREKMRSGGVDELAVEVFAHYYRLLERGETGMIPESPSSPWQPSRSPASTSTTRSQAEAIRTTAIIKLNGGLGTSMGMERAKSLLCVRSGLSFLDIIARQVLHLREVYDAKLPVMFMNSFRTSADTMAALGALRRPAGGGSAAGVPPEQGAEAAARLSRAGQLPEGTRPRMVPARPWRPLHRPALLGDDR